ncbi:MAG TPA: hypothetical protein VIF82_06275 [Burkholderiaceae bacterium]|jgi:chromosome partitioning protein
MIIVIATENGGIEKSILANNMATLRALDGGKVLLIDGDQQRNSFAWGRARYEAGVKPTVTTLAISAKGLQPELENLTPHYSDIVIDAEGRDCMGSRSALITARTALIPIRPDLMDQACEDKLIARISTVRLFNPCLRVLFVITCIGNDPTLQELVNVRSLVAKIPAATLASTVIHDQIVLRSAHSKGLSISEYKPADQCAVTEMRNLYSEVFGLENATHRFTSERFNLASSAA